MGTKKNENLSQPSALNRRGRPKGVPNKVTREAKEVCGRIIDDPKYRAALRKRMIEGTAGAMEAVVWAYAKGKPKDEAPPPQWNIDPATLATMSTEDLEKALGHAEIVQNFLSGKAKP